MRLVLSPLVIIISTFSSVSASDCQVSQWTSWSQCFGGCEVALEVRNRDVLVPALPVPGQKTNFQPCPYLYETRSCKPQHCGRIEEVDMPTPGPILSSDTSHQDNTVTEHEPRRPVMARKWIMGKERQFTPRSQERVRNGEGEAMPSRQSVIKKQPEYYINTLTLDLPMKNKMTADVEKRLRGRVHIDQIKFKNFEATTLEPELNEVLRHLERAAELNLPVDEKQIRTTLKKNKKLVKALVDAYRSRKVVVTTTKAPENLQDLMTKLMETTTYVPVSTVPKESISTSQVVTTPSSWHHGNGYIPNTRKHASDITSKLYMTKEIVQILNEDSMKKKAQLPPSEDCRENNRCCRVVRETCANGAEPIMVKRYYRPKGVTKCVAYDYPRCSQADEMEEQPITFVQNCQDLCFSVPEKRISPLYILDEDY